MAHRKHLDRRHRCTEWRGSRLAGLILLLCAASIARALPPEVPAQASPEGMGRALLIGIDAYASRELPDLRGAGNDIELVANLLTTRFGFRDVRMLRDAEATRSGIEQAFAGLARDAGPRDVVLVHYSGHGAQVADRNGDEADRLDETLVPHDGRMPGVRDIVDDELQAWLSRIRSRRLIVVLDSCHSGTATRHSNPHLVARNASIDTRSALYDIVPTPATASVELEQDRSLIVFSAAAADEPALGGLIDGSYFGLFTRALVRAVSQSDPSMTARETLERASQHYRDIVAKLGARAATPQLEGVAQHLDEPLFGKLGASLAARLPYADVKVQGHAIRIVRGLALGGAVGSRWAVFGSGDGEFAPGTAVAQARVHAIVGDDSLLTMEWLEPGTARSALDGARAIAITPSLEETIPVRVEAEPERRRGIVSLLRERLPDVRIVGTTQFARYVIVERLDDFLLLDASGNHVLERALSIEEVVRIVGRTMNATTLLAVDNAMSEMRLDIRAVQQGGAGEASTMPERSIVDAPGVGFERFRGRGPDTTRYRCYRGEGDEPSLANSLQLAVRSNEDCYLTVASVDAVGQVSLLFPLSRANPNFLPHGHIRADQTVLIPDSVSRRNRSGILYLYSEPAGIDTVRVFAARDLAVANRIREAIERAASGELAANRILQDLQQSLAAISTRGVVAVDTGIDLEDATTADRYDADWTAAAIKVEVIR